MNLLKKIYYGCTDLVPLQLLTRSSPVTSLFPYHHVVSDERLPHIINLYPYKNVRQFSADLDFLMKNFQPISPADLVTFVNTHRKLPERKFLLTFDDGFREVSEVIAPILKRKGIPAIFFINPAFIDNKEMFYRNKISLILQAMEDRKTDKGLFKQIAGILNQTSNEFSELKQALLKIRQSDKDKLDEIALLLDISFGDYLKTSRPWLTSEELADLAEQGFCLGGHSWDHPYYQSLTLEEQVRQTIDSCEFIKKYNKGETTFSFPHSDESLPQQLFDRLNKPETGIDLLFGIQNQKNEISNKMIHRFNSERPQVGFSSQVKGMLAYMIIQKALNKQTIQRNYA
jgi:peptidoglycan/xylan/chitin deacetylase (PgdA/CDA1 family)